LKLARTRPFTSSRLYRWVKPEKNPMNGTIDPEVPDPELDLSNDEGEGEDEESSDTLIEEWETDNGIVYEFHGLEDHDEVLVVEPYDDEDPPPARAEGEEKDQIVGIALDIDDLEETMDILKQIHKKMVERQLSRSPKMKPTPRAAQRKP
jgi:hypothetical protein